MISVCIRRHGGFCLQSIYYCYPRVHSSHLKQECIISNGSTYGCPLIVNPCLVRGEYALDTSPSFLIFLTHIKKASNSTQYVFVSCLCYYFINDSTLRGEAIMISICVKKLKLLMISFALFADWRWNEAWDHLANGISLAFTNRDFCRVSSYFRSGILHDDFCSSNGLQNC